MSNELKNIFLTYESILSKKSFLLEVDISGIDELVYNPATKAGGTIGHGYDQGRKVKGITWNNHDNHLHIGFTNRKVAMEVIDYAHSLGLKTTENPYAKSDPNQKVDTVHSKNSFHYKVFPGEPKVGAAVDISGDPNKITNLIKWIESKYVGGNLTIDKTTDDVSGDTSQKVDITKPQSTPSTLKPAFWDMSPEELQESFGKNVIENYGVVVIPARNNEKIKSPIPGKIINSRYSSGCNNPITIEIEKNKGFLMFCGISFPSSFSKGDKIKKGDVLGKTKDDVKVTYFDSNFKTNYLKDDTFDKSSFEDDSDNVKKTNSSEPTYYDPLSMALPHMIASVFKDKTDPKTGKVEKRMGYATDKKQVDPWIVNALSKPFQKIGKSLGTNKSSKLEENISRIKNLLK
jgi:hypothetical protein